MEWKVIEGIDRSLHRRLSGYDTSGELFRSFIENNACFHKNCLGKYEKQKLKRKNESNKSDGGIKIPKVTRRSMQATTFTVACFFAKVWEILSIAEH